MTLHPRRLSFHSGQVYVKGTVLSKTGRIQPPAWSALTVFWQQHPCKYKKSLKTIPINNLEEVCTGTLQEHNLSQQTPGQTEAGEAVELPLEKPWQDTCSRQRRCLPGSPRGKALRAACGCPRMDETKLDSYQEPCATQWSANPPGSHGPKAWQRGQAHTQK